MSPPGPGRVPSVALTPAASARANCISLASDARRSLAVGLRPLRGRGRGHHGEQAFGERIERHGCSG